MYNTGSYHHPYYTPSTPRLRRSHSVPAMSSTRTRYKSSIAASNVVAFTGSSSVGLSYRARAYDNARSSVHVPQTTFPAKSLANASNLQPPPSYRHSMVKLGSETKSGQPWSLQQTRRPDLYYYAPRTYSSGSGSYYSTYTHSRRPVPSAAYRLATKLPSYAYDRPGTYPTSLTPLPRKFSSNSDKRHRVPMGNKPVVVQTQDHLGRVSHYLI